MHSITDRQTNGQTDGRHVDANSEHSVQQYYRLKPLREFRSGSIKLSAQLKQDWNKTQIKQFRRQSAEKKTLFFV